MSTCCYPFPDPVPRRLPITHIFPQLCANEVPDLLRGACWNGPVLIATDDGSRGAVADP